MDGIYKGKERKKGREEREEREEREKAKVLCKYLLNTTRKEVKRKN